VDTWGYVNIFSVDSAGGLLENARRRMDESGRFQGLNEAASHLCCALDELATSGYEGLASPLRILLETIDAEISWLESGPTPER
jgi:hypothetical protein